MDVLLKHSNVFSIKSLPAGLLCPSINYLTDENKKLYQWNPAFLVDLSYNNHSLKSTILEKAAVGLGEPLGFRGGVSARTVFYTVFREASV